MWSTTALLFMHRCNHYSNTFILLEGQMEEISWCSLGTCIINFRLSPVVRLF